ncbi:hypothetical protein HHI36_021987 [Cryptolaemus montrouzieri]|uniref:Uncharacterized protein n=1 Tax=Cryptolaemus montrouzieri TaxID=559131 RepID=A0ABD2MZ70_9CUCU
MIFTYILFFLFLSLSVSQGEASYNHYLPTRYYTPSTYYKSYSDDNVYITDKYGNTVAVEPYWARSAKNYEYTKPYYSSKCYNCVTSRSYTYDPYPYARKVYVKDQYGNSVLVNPYYTSDVYRKNYYYPSSRSGRYYSSGKSYSSHEDYVYVNDMYGRTRAVPKASYLYEYAKGY